MFELFGLKRYWQANNGGATGGAADTTDAAAQAAAATAAAAAATAAAGADDGEAYDKDRAMKTITALREKEKLGTAAAKDRDALKARLDAIETAQLSDAEKLKKQATDAEGKLTASQAALKQAQTERAVERSARKLNIVDEDAALRLLDHAKIEYGDDGQPKNIEALLTQLVKDKPYLVATGAAAASGGATTNAARTAGGGVLTKEMLKTMTPQEIAELDPKKIDEALKR